MQTVLSQQPLADCEIGDIINILHKHSSVSVSFVDPIVNMTELERAQVLRSTLCVKLDRNVYFEIVRPTVWEFSLI